jgi:hypothetical protein
MGLGEAAGRLLAAVDWEREAYPAYDDFLALPVFVLFFPTVRYLLDRFVFEVRLHSPSFFLSSVVSRSSALRWTRARSLLPRNSPQLFAGSPGSNRSLYNCLG